MILSADSLSSFWELLKIVSDRSYDRAPGQHGSRRRAPWDALGSIDLVRAKRGESGLRTLAPTSKELAPRPDALEWTITLN